MPFIKSGELIFKIHIYISFTPLYIDKIVDNNVLGSKIQQGSIDFNYVEMMNLNLMGEHMGTVKYRFMLNPRGLIHHTV